MTVQIENYTPGGKLLLDCTLEQLNRTALAIRGDGMLRMHAMGRLLDELCEVARQRGYNAMTDASGFTERFTGPVTLTNS